MSLRSMISGSGKAVQVVLLLRKKRLRWGWIRVKLQNVNESLKSSCTLRNEVSELQDLRYIRRLLLDYHDED